ncbi:MAG: hypothetical protein OHK0046_02810 [Anaerolineae bacterium]
MTTSPRADVTLTGLLGDFRLLLILFVAFRLGLLMVYQPILLDDGQERGLNAGGDRQYHYALAELTDEGLWPFVDWWSEFPPVWYLLTTAVYQSQGEGVNYAGWSMMLGLIILAFDAGNLILMRRIGAHLYGDATGMALAWVYAVSLAPLVFIWWNFENIVAFFLLLGLWFLLRQQHVRAAGAIAIGALTKFTPALLFGALLRYRPPRVVIQVVAVALAIFAGVYALLYVNNAANDGDPAMVTTSLTAQFGKASYQTVWALIDGNYTTGNFGTVESHLDAAAANTLYGSPAVIPSFVRLALAGAVGLFVFLRVRRFDDRGLVAFVGITVLIFFLQAQGWSPQWLVQIVPLILLAFPTKNGILITVVLTLLVFAEYPLLFIRTGDTGGVITGVLRAPFAVLIISRTFILIGVCLALYQTLRQEPIV